MEDRKREKHSAEQDAEEAQRRRDAELMQTFLIYHRIASRHGGSPIDLMPRELQPEMREWCERHAGQQAVERVIKDSGGKLPGPGDV